MKFKHTLVAAALVTLSAPASAGLVYDWHDGDASMQIVFKDSYAPGTSFTIPFRFLEDATSPIARINFAFGSEKRVYSQSTGVETAGIGFPVEGGGTIPAGGGFAALDLCFWSCVDNHFAELLDGSWTAKFEGSLIGAPPDGHLVHDDHWINAAGAAGAFTPRGVPEPNALALALLGLVAIGAAAAAKPR